MTASVLPSLPLNSPAGLGGLVDALAMTLCRGVGTGVVYSWDAHQASPAGEVAILRLEDGVKLTMDGQHEVLPEKNAERFLKLIQDRYDLCLGASVVRQKLKSRN
ncbi:hypothetical protein [Aureimonas pseudogalii]|uniref:Ferric-dicitrate binding protein FerR (Iron transport regulator) n=1 Tax=Aureimonas pseudogalii TaxID=1744844 RepID=A0A7W6H3B0_9HYPH|nr:hypothetical protein [Aureimonas pseudogalii]MBB3997861.1 ferric-dicitrate binding protein FerR (iron transport regulator) [Aureimonas pseudogalii]